MLRVIRNHRNAAYGETDGYEGLEVKPVPLDHANCPDPRLVDLAMPAGTRRCSWARSTAIATPSPP